MQYKKLKAGQTIIEFHNSWLGEETVMVNGQVVSKKSSLWGTHHYFSTIEEGHNIRYVLTTKVNANLQVLIDLRRNGQLIMENIAVNYGTIPKKPQNTAKKAGIVKLKEYDLELALVEFQKALDVDPSDPEIYFHMACAYSVLEETEKGFEAIKLAVKNNLMELDMIFKHDMLAFLRMNDAFEDFVNSNFKNYEISSD